MFILLAAASVCLPAQEKENAAKSYRVETNRFGANWFISGGVGAQMYFGDNDGKADFGKRLAPALDIAVGKWFTPGIGLRVAYNGLQAKGATPYANGPLVDGGQYSNGYYKEKWNVVNLHGDVLLNLTNMFCGYKEDRLYSFIPYVGAGFVHTGKGPGYDELGINAGLINRFRLSSALDLNVELRGLLMKGAFGNSGPEGLAGLTVGVTPYELNAAYAAIANQGTYVEPKLYTRVLDSDGNVLLDNTSPYSRQVLKETTAFLLTSAMEDVVTKGTGTRAKFDGMSIAGKTGTSTKTVDVWFSGYTPYYTCTVWTGYDNNVGMSSSSTNNEANISKLLWKAVMKQIHENLPNQQFPVPEGIVQMEVCSQSGKLPVPGFCDGYVVSEYFAEGTEPTESCDIHYEGELCAYDHLPASPECPFKTYGRAQLPLVEDASLISGSTMVTENPDGTLTYVTPPTNSHCQHDASFFANPDYESILNNQQWEMNQNGVSFGDDSEE